MKIREPKQHLNETESTTNKLPFFQKQALHNQSFSSQGTQKQPCTKFERSAVPTMALLADNRLSGSGSETRLNIPHNNLYILFHHQQSRPIPWDENIFIVDKNNKILIIKLNFHVHNNILEVKKWNINWIPRIFISAPPSCLIESYHEIQL